MGGLFNLIFPMLLLPSLFALGLRELGLLLFYSMRALDCWCYWIRCRVLRGLYLW